VPTLVLSTDPAGALADVLGSALGGTPCPVANVANLSACQLDATAARAVFVEQWGETLATIIDRGTYLDREDIQGLIDATLPGIDETMALLALADLADRGEWQRVILDTAPTGHTLRLLGLPDTFRAVIELLDTMQAKHRFMVSALLHRYRPDSADAFISDLRTRIARLHALTSDANRTAVVLVARPEAVVIAETTRYAAALERAGFAVRSVVMNALPESDASIATTMDDVRRAVPAASLFSVGALGVLPAGNAGVERWSAGVRRWSAPGPKRRRPVVRASDVQPERDAHAADSIAALPVASAFVNAIPPVLIVGGKGGVGKTSASCAIALALARAGHRTFLVSTDPAPSIADALDQPIGDETCEVRDGHGLVARQIDASAAFARWRAQYESRVDSAFDALMGPGLDAAHDRAIARQLLALAPPGIDELYALVWLGDALADGQYERIVIDPAPTGHLVRLLEMPALALDWSHRLLRLMLKYRELAGGNEVSADLLAFARRTRAVGALLLDESRAGVVVVALDEPIVRLEAARVIDRVRGLGSHVPGVIWNRARGVPEPLPVQPPVRHFVAADVTPPPVGPARLSRWLEDWRALEIDG
jgi:arsenite/tail-anchored protein-transporting ATPase